MPTAIILTLTHAEAKALVKLAVAAQTDGPKTLAAYRDMWQQLRGGEEHIKQQLTTTDLQRAVSVLGTLYDFVQETENETPWL